MDSSTFIKQEPVESAIKYEPTTTTTATVGSAFETYINSDFIEENSVPSSTTNNNNNPPHMNFDLDVSNSEMMCYFMDSEVLSNNVTSNNNHLPINQLLDHNGMNYLNSHGLPPYSQPPSKPTTRKSTVSTKKKATGNRKASPKSNSSENPGDNSAAFRPDLVLSPDELDMIAKANPKERRQIRNKISARNFRLRRKEYVNDLEQRASKFEEESSLLQEIISTNETETMQLKNCLEDLTRKFKLVTSSFSDLIQFKGLDPIDDITINSDGQLSPSQVHHESLLTCRELSSFDGNGINHEVSSEGNLSTMFPSSRDRTLMVKA